MSADRKHRALILSGDHYHKADDAFVGIGEVLQGLGIEVATTADYTSLGRDSLADKDLLVILRDGVEGAPGAQFAWMQPEQEQAIEEFVLRGGAFLALHNAGWGYPWKGAYRRTLGGYYVGHPPYAPFHVEVVNKTHPVTAGVESYDIEDEQHFLYFDYERVKPLLVSQGQDGRQSVAGWAYDYGQGRVVYLPHGHTLEVNRHPSFQKLLKNAVRWLLRMD